MKKTFVIFLAVCLVMCLLPFVGMFFFPTTRTSENKPMAPAPALVEDGKLNSEFFQDFETYFTQRMALRNPMLYADAAIQSHVFGVSSVDGVIKGTDGWLYYCSTLDDYLGNNMLSARQLYNLAHNFSLIRDYLQSQGVDFVLSIAPNKNSLYGEHMPYYYQQQVTQYQNARRLAPYLAQQAVPYADLFRLFEQQSQVLYLKGDSHWNNRGACLVYNELMDSLSIPHNTYAQQEPKPFQNRNGDLNRMLYSFYGPGETDYAYDLAGNYTYTTGKTVEDGLIVTQNPKGQGTLLMFRDSFANTLIPFFSEHFATACYSKGEPHALERLLQTHNPDCVILEKVERNLNNYLDTPPILSAPAVPVPARVFWSDKTAEFTMTVCQYAPQYLEVRGTVDPDALQLTSRLLVEVEGMVYKAYHTGENGFVIYLDKTLLTEADARIQVYVLDDDVVHRVGEKTLPVPEK